MRRTSRCCSRGRGTSGIEVDRAGSLCQGTRPMTRPDEERPDQSYAENGGDSPASLAADHRSRFVIWTSISCLPWVGIWAATTDIFLSQPVAYDTRILVAFPSGLAVACLTTIAALASLRHGAEFIIPMMASLGYVAYSACSLSSPIRGAGSCEGDEPAATMAGDLVRSRVSLSPLGLPWCRLVPRPSRANEQPAKAKIRHHRRSRALA